MLVRSILAVVCVFCCVATAFGEGLEDLIWLRGTRTLETVQSGWQTLQTHTHYDILGIAYTNGTVYWIESLGVHRSRLRRAVLHPNGYLTQSEYYNYEFPSRLQGIAAEKGTSNVYVTSAWGHIIKVSFDSGLSHDMDGMMGDEKRRQANHRIIKTVVLPTHIAVANGYVFFYDAGSHKIQRITTSGYGLHDVYRGAYNFKGLTVNDTRVAWIYGNRIHTSDYQGTTHNILSWLPFNLHAVALSNNYLFYASRNRIYRSRLDGRNRVELAFNVHGMRSIVVRPRIEDRRVSNRLSYDVDSDGDVDLADVKLVRRNIGSTRVSHWRFDVNGDGRIDETDIRLVKDEAIRQIAAAAPRMPYIIPNGKSFRTWGSLRRR